MKPLNPDVLPVLPLNGVVMEECVAMGMFDNGVVISYLEKDIAVLFTWEELVESGKEIANPKAEKEVEKELKKGEIREIKPPK